MLPTGFLRNLSTSSERTGSASNIKIVGSYWLLFAYCIGAALFVRLIAPPLPAVVWFSFTGVILAAVLISWGAEAAQFVVSQGLASAIIALLQVVPEFMVEATIAWRREIDLMLANLTGSNRLLMGVGWPLVMLTAYLYSKHKTGKGIRYIELRRDTVIQVLALMLSSGYFLLVIARHQLSLLDTFVLAGVFVLYMALLQRLPEEEGEKKEDLIAMARYLATIPHAREQFVKLLGIFVIGGFTMWAMAAPFLDSMKTVAAAMGVTAFIFVQWCAPFLSEFPEKVTAFYWAKSVKLAPMGLLNLISSKVNQWTLLTSMIPLVYSVSLGRVEAIPLTAHHEEELFLSLVMSVYGAVLLLKLRFTRLDAVTLFVLWLIQFVFPYHLPLLGDAQWNNTRLLTAAAFAALSILQLVMHRRDIHLLQDFQFIADLVRSKGKGPSQASAQAD
ncbi:MAG: hypothetical protein ACM3JD_18315 [Rudaea sp.]